MPVRTIRSSSADSAELIHASAVAINGRGVLLIGPSGSGKSDLALRLIDRGAILVADDVVELRPVAGTLVASAPEVTRGKLEVRGVGIIAFPPIDSAPVALAVRLTDDCDKTGILGIQVATISTNVSYASAPIAIERAAGAGTPT